MFLEYFPKVLASAKCPTKLINEYKKTKEQILNLVINSDQQFI